MVEYELEQNDGIYRRRGYGAFGDIVSPCKINHRNPQT